MTHPLKALEAALPSLKGTSAELIATCAVTRILSGHSAMFTVTNVELGLIARAMAVEPVTGCDTYTVSVEEGGAGVVFQSVKIR